MQFEISAPRALRAEPCPEKGRYRFSEPARLASLEAALQRFGVSAAEVPTTLRDIESTIRWLYKACDGVWSVDELTAEVCLALLDPKSGLRYDPEKGGLGRYLHRVMWNRLEPSRPDRPVVVPKTRSRETTRLQQSKTSARKCAEQSLPRDEDAGTESDSKVRRDPAQIVDAEADPFLQLIRAANVAEHERRLEAMMESLPTVVRGYAPDGAIPPSLTHRQIKDTVAREWAEFERRTGIRPDKVWVRRSKCWVTRWVRGTCAREHRPLGAEKRATHLELTGSLVFGGP